MGTWWYQLSVFIHVLSAITWIGGMLFIVMVMAPLLRSPDFRPQATRVLHSTGKKFKKIGWACLILLFITGFINAGARWGFSVIFTSVFWATPYPGQILMHKLFIYLVIIVLSYVHDYHIGPNAVSAMRAAADAPETLKLRKAASRMGRLSLLLALAVLWLALRLVRG
jgi:copper resistance protein D